MKDHTLGAYNIANLRDMARRRLPNGLFAFIDRGTEDEVALRNNRTAFERIKLTAHALEDIAGRSLETTLFGKRQSMPIAIAPTGTAGLMWYNGEIAQARAAAAAGIPFTLSIASTTSLETVAEQTAGATLWFQLFMWPDKSLTAKLVERVKAAGYQALIMTIDSVVPANREYNRRTGYTIPFSFNRYNITDVVMHPRWMFGVLARYVMTTGLPRYQNYPGELKHKVTAAPMSGAMMKANAVTWDDLRMLRKIWPHKLLVKGILRPQDAVKAADCGADGVIVSNHGGRNFDSTIATIDALPDVVDAVGDRITVLVDSGFRRGSDVIKALALGAKTVLVGRSVLYGTASAGQAGAARAIDIFREEIDRGLALLGCTSVPALNREFVRFMR